MAATTTLLGLVTPTQGTLTGTWGDTVNYGISDYLDIAIAGTLSFAGDGAITLANTTGSSSGNSIGATTAQYAIIRVTGTLTTAKIITGPSYSKTYLVVNAATGSTVTFKASGQTGVSIAVGETALVYYNGTDYVKVVGTATAGAAGGSTTQVQYNNSGVLAGITGATSNGTALTLVAPNLGSPFSVGTMPAFTLGGTVSGGGNQINNVVIGTTTPLAGSFTTVTATGRSGVTMSGQTSAVSLGQVSTDTTYGLLSFNGAFAATTLTGIWGGAGTPDMVIGVPTSGTIYSRVNNSTVTLLNSTGLAVTGALTATGRSGVTMSGQTSAVSFGQVSSDPTYGLISFNGAFAATTLTGIWGGAGTPDMILNVPTGGSIVSRVANSTGTLLNSTGFQVTNTLSGGTSGTAYSFSGSAPATSLTLDSSGNLGVGTATPASFGCLGVAKAITTGSVNVSAAFSDSIFNTFRITHASGSLGLNFDDTNLIFQSGGTSPTTRMTLNSSGNLGLGVTPSAWNSVYRAMQIGSGTSISGRTDDATFTEVMSNSYRATDGTWKYVTTNVATRYDQGGGAHAWSTAASGTAGNAITFTQAMTLDASGNLGIGTTSPNGKFEVASAAAGETVGLFLADATNNTVYVGRLSTTPGSGSSFVVRGRQNSAVFTVNSLDNNAKTATTLGVGDATPSASGAGITFPATQSSSSDANTLDDYEEGTWTPVIVGATTAGTGTYSSQVGRYTKIGNTVRIYFAVVWSAHTGTGTTIVTGFPFSSNAGGQTPFSVFTYGETFTALNVANGGIMSNGTTQWEHYQVPVGGGNSSGIPIYNGSAEIQVSGVYQTA